MNNGMINKASPWQINQMVPDPTSVVREGEVQPLTMMPEAAKSKTGSGLSFMQALKKALGMKRENAKHEDSGSLGSQERSDALRELLNS